MRVRSLILAPIVAVNLFSLYSPRAIAGALTQVKPLPAWVQPLPLPAGTEGDSGDDQSGIIHILADHQIRVTAGSIERYYRRVKKVISASGLEEVAELQLDFEPSYQQLVIHHIRILRGEMVVDALRPREIKIIQQESELDQRLYNGTLSALIFLHDVRVGDRIDYAYSINGANPVLRGRFADSFTLGISRPVEKLQWRLLWPAGRELYYRALNSELQPRTRPVGSEIEYTWEQGRAPALEIDDSAPSWFNPVPMVELSDFAGWDEVVRWALPLYEVSRPLSPALLKQIERWRTDHENAGDRLLAALRFVQDEIRYLGIEMGPYSHLPTQPSIVFERRFGDCKDKSLLLATILKSLGIEAHPALVDTDAQQNVADHQPSPYAFNHVIVQAKVDGVAYWMDATASLQRGPLSQRYNPDYGRALVVRETTADLEEIPRSIKKEPTTIVSEIYRVTSFDSPVSLEVVTTYREADADAMRYQLSQQTISDLGKSYLNYYAEIDPGIEADAPPRVLDDEQSNRVTVTEKYTIPGFWKSGARQFFAGRISEEMRRPGISRRSMPLGIYHPVNVSQSIEIHMPEASPISKDSKTITTDALRYSYQTDYSGKIIRLNYQIQTLQDHVPVAGVARHLDAVEKIDATLGFELWRDRWQSPATGGWVVFAVFALLFGPFLIFGMVRLAKSRLARQRLGEFKERLRVSPGETAETAIRVSSDSEFGRHLEAFRCSCGRTFYKEGATVQRENGVFDGQRIIIVGLKCDVCGNSRDVYFAPPQPARAASH